MKLILLISFCTCFSFVVTDNGDVPSAPVQADKAPNNVLKDSEAIISQPASGTLQEKVSSESNNKEIHNTDPQTKESRSESPEQHKTDQIVIDKKDLDIEDQIHEGHADTGSNNEMTKEQPKTNPSSSEEVTPNTEAEKKTDQTEAESPSPVSEEIVKQDEEIQTFTEWTQKVLEEEKHKTSTETPGSVSKSKRSTNYASKECGAKVLASNPEAENVKLLLTNSKDEYMINPCKVAKKWFVIELCEPIHISHFEVASFELFSSQPKTFKISLSDRYPTKEWTNVGEFTATEERIPQTFNMKQGYVVQFVRVELLDHYGTEHFCPLTWFKSFGVPVEYDEYGHKAVVNDDDQDMDEVLLRNGDNTEETGTHKNLFEEATDTVMKLVKKVLNVEDKNDQKNAGKNGTVSSEGQSLNETYLANRTSDGILLPCVPEVPEAKKQRKFQPSPPHPHQTGTVTKSDIDDKKTKQGESIVIKLEDHEQVPSVSDELVTLIPTDDDDDITSCDISAVEKTDLFYYQRPVCRYLEVMMYPQKYPSCSVNDSHQEGCHRGNKTDPPGSSVIKDSSRTDSYVIAPSESMPVVTEQTSETQSETKTLSVRSTSKDTVMSTSSASSKTVVQTSKSESTIAATSSTRIEPSSLAGESSVREPESSVTMDISAAIQPSSTVKSEVSAGETTPALDSSSVLKGGDFILVDKTPNTQQTTDIKVHPEVPSALEASKIDPTSSQLVLETPSINVNISEGPNIDIVEPVVVGDNVPAVQDSRDLKLIHVPVLPYQKRETAIMRLNNRIKALEMNVSLSSRFLEEMSQKFKKQTEDMIKQHMFDKTVSELSNITKAIEIQSHIQKQKIDVLETTVQNLTEIVVRLTERVEDLNQQVNDREYKYIVAVVVLCVVTMVLMRRRPPKTQSQPEQTTQPKPIIKRRRNSFSVSENDRTESLGPALQRFNSESTLVDPRHFSSDADPGGTSHAKKKKKKKHKMNGSSSSLSGDVRTPNHKDDINSAGLLFGTRETTPDKNKKGLSRSESYGGLFCLLSNDRKDNKVKPPDKFQENNAASTRQSWLGGATQKKGNKQGKICQPGRVSDGSTHGKRSGSLNGCDSDLNGHFSSSNGNSMNNEIYVVSPFKKGFSFSKGSMQNGHKDPSCGKPGRKSHRRTGSTDSTLRAVSFKEMNGHR